jgi:K+-transporting ATPase KdpF subunit
VVLHKYDKREQQKEDGNGCNVYRRDCAVFRIDLGVCRRLCQVGRKIMEIWQIGGVVALGLLVYLVHALLNAEEL